MKKTQKLALMKLIKEKMIIRARESFWEYCKAIAPDFYMEHRTYQKDFANQMQDLYEGKILNDKGEVMRGALISFPPRHGKSRTMTLFATWMLGKENEKSVITVSYNASMATTFSRNTRDIIMQEQLDTTISFQDVFPNTRIKRGDASVNSWSLEGSHFSYYGGGFNSSITGKGATLALIIDDPVKNAEEALNPEHLEKLYSKYTDTLMSRAEKGALTIVIQTRWSKNDPIGKILSSEDGKNFVEINYKACEDEEAGIMLCDDLLDFSSYLRLKRNVSDIIFQANYQQAMIDRKGALYPDISNNKYKDIPRDANGNPVFENYVAYVDTADAGKDYFAVVFAGLYQAQFYIIDIIYNQDAIDKNEDLLIKKLIENNINVCKIESNFGGKVFARNVEKRLYSEHGLTKPIIQTLHQNNNKETRILVNSPQVNNNVFFPSDVSVRFPVAWESITTFPKDPRKAKNDDIEDALTGMVESWGANAQGGFQVVNSNQIR